jgi:hypothetical protein
LEVGAVVVDGGGEDFDALVGSEGKLMRFGGGLVGFVMGGDEVRQLVVNEGSGGNVSQSVVEDLVAVSKSVEQLGWGGVVDGRHWGCVELVLEGAYDRGVGEECRVWQVG